MPIDRSLLPPLPGKPEWYVDGDPATVTAPPVDPVPPLPLQVELPAVVEPEPVLATDPGLPPEQVLPSDLHGGRGLRKMKALAGKLRA